MSTGNKIRCSPSNPSSLVLKSLLQELICQAALKHYSVSLTHCWYKML